MRTDEDLAYGIQQGRRNDLAELVERHHSPLIGYLYRLSGGDRLLAEDLAQEVFLRVLRSISQYRHPHPFKPWLYQIATNLARDHFKRAESRYVVAMPDDASSFPADSQPEDAFLLSAEGQSVAQAIRLLPLHQREVVVLRYYQELSLAEIAGALAIPVGTVKSRLSLGIQRLRAMLLEQEFES